MGVFDLLRSVLGFGDSGDSTDSTGTSVAVGTERNPNGEETDGTPDVGTDERDHEPLDTDAGNAAAAAGTDATASTDSMVESPDSDPETAAEPAEAGTGVTEHSGTETPAAEPAEAAGPVPDEPEGTDAPGDAADAEDGNDTADVADSHDAADAEGGTTVADSVETVDGIGPAYAERLGSAGVETVPELREADAVSLAEATDISEKRISRWQERAAE